MEERERRTTEASLELLLTISNDAERPEFFINSSGIHTKCSNESVPLGMGLEVEIVKVRIML